MAYEQHLQDAAGEVAQCAVITLSDTRTAATDSSGKRIGELLVAAGHVVASYYILPDDPAILDRRLADLIGTLPPVAVSHAAMPLSNLTPGVITAGDSGLEVILTNGGTGISQRDQTIDVVARYIDQPLPGFGELFRMLSWEQIGSGAMLSRAVGGIGRGKIIFAMPGSTAAVELAMTRLILPELKHLLRELHK